MPPADQSKLPPWFGEIEFASWMCEGRSGNEITLPEHVYMNFSRPPAQMSFDEYTEWYDEHQRINIENTETLNQGWRFRLIGDGDGRENGPSHLALYELTADMQQMSADLAAATQAGRVSLPDWFSRSASGEAIALDDRVLAP